MRTAGPNEASLRIIDASAGAGRGERLKAGAFVSLQVRGRIGPGRYEVAIGGRLFVASSASQLEPGTRMTARVERLGGSTILRTSAPDDSPAEGRELPRASAAALVASAGLPGDAAAYAALTALLREGVAPSPPALARVRRAALADAGERTDLAARMEAKGMPSDEEALEGLLRDCAPTSSDGRREATGGEDFRAGGDSTRDRPREEADFADLGRDIERSIPEPELGRVLGALLRALATRCGEAERRPGGEGETLALFNQLRGPEGSWVIVPFRFALDAVDFAGSFRIQLPYVRGGAGLLEARFTASRGSIPEQWTAVLGFGGGRASTLRIGSPEEREGSLSGAAFEAFAAELASLSCSVRRMPRGEAEGAGGKGLDLDA